MPILKLTDILAHFSLAFFSYLSTESFFLNVLSALLLCRIVCTQKFRFALRTFIPTKAIWKEKRRKLISLLPFVFRKTAHRNNIYLWVFGVRVFMTPPRYMQPAYIEMILHYRLSHNLVTWDVDQDLHPKLHIVRQTILPHIKRMCFYLLS